MAFITAFYQTVGLCVDNGVAVLTRVIAGIAALQAKEWKFMKTFSTLFIFFG